VPQGDRGRLYQRKDFTAESVRTLWQNFENGLITEYLAHKAERDAAIDLLPLPAGS